MGLVTWGFTSSIDGFIAGPGHDMSWLGASGESLDPELLAELASAPGVIISGRDGYDAARAQEAERDELTSEAYGGAWSETEIVLTHRPQEIADDPRITAMDCGIVEAVARAREIAGEKDVQIISAQIGRQALEADLVDEIQVFSAPVLLGDGIRAFDVPGGRRIDLELLRICDRSPRAFGRVYRPKGHVPSA